MNRIATCFLLFIVSGFGLFAQTFSPLAIMESMDASAGSSGKFCNQQIVNARPAIAFYDSTHGNLMFVRAIDVSGTNWNSPVVADDHGDVGQHCSMQIVNGYPAMSYFDNTFKRLLYVRALDSNGTSWGTPMILDDTPGLIPGLYTSLEVVNGNPAIAYNEFLNMDLKYIRANDSNGNSWNSPQTVVSTNSVGTDAKLFVVNGNPAIAYNEQMSGSVNFVRANDNIGSTWGTPIIVSGIGDVGYHISTEVIQGAPAISYYDQTTTALKYVRASNPNGSGWQASITVDNGGNVGKYSSLTIINGLPAISYANSNNNSCNYVRALDANGGTWGPPVQATSIGSGSRYSSLVTINGNPAISYATYGLHARLNFIRATDANGNSWGPIVSFGNPRSSGSQVSMAVVKGKPASVSIDPINLKIVYCRAQDSAGSIWDSSIVVLPTTQIATYPSLAQINGIPTITYYNTTTYDLMYIRAADSLGQNWLSPRRIDSAGNVGRYTQLFSLNGKPAVLYEDELAATMKFICAIDSVGSAWNSSIFPAPLISTDKYATLSEIGGKPVIAFLNSNLNGIYFTMANDSFGMSWRQPVLIDMGSGFAQSSPGITAIDGHPFVVYSDPISYTLVCRTSTDSIGLNWGPIIYTSPTAYYGFDSDILIINGRPVVSYLEVDRQMFIAANDRTGTTWGTEIFVDSLLPNIYFPYSGMVDLGGFAGIGHDNGREQYAYFTSACITPLAPEHTATNGTCTGDTTILSASGYGTLSWYDAPTGGNYLGSGNSFSAGVLSSATTYYVQDSTCSTSARTAITANLIPLPVFSLTGNAPICLGDSVTLSAMATGYSWSWSTGGTTNSEIFSPSVTTNYTIGATDNNGCQSVLPFTVVVIQPAILNQTIAICQNDTFHVGPNAYYQSGVYTDSTTSVSGCDSVIITSLTVQPLIDTTINYVSGVLSSLETGAVYQWINCATMNPIAGATSQTFTPTQNGTYAAIISAGPCTDTSECFNVTDVGIVDFSIATWEFTVAPNPSSGQFAITTTGANAPIEFEIVNTIGQIVKTETKNNSATVTLQLDVPGVYFVLARRGSDVKSAKIIVE